MRIILFIAGAGLILAGITQPARAVQTVSLSWQPSPGKNVAGYNLYYGPAADTFDHMIAVGTNTSASIYGLAEGQKFYFVVTAYDRVLWESPPSNVASFVVPLRPVLIISTPAGSQKMTNALATVKGVAMGTNKVSGVWCQLNNGPWARASSTNQWTNWSSSLPLVVGTNVIKAYAINLNGGCSITSSVSVFSGGAFKMQFQTAALKVSPVTGPAFTLQLSSNLTGRIEYSTNLVDWLSLTNFRSMTNSAMTFNDPAAIKSPRRFYRAVTL